jgi:hypothetical protein
MVAPEVKEWVARFVFVGGLLFMAAWLLKPGVGSLPAVRRERCTNNLKQLALGLQEYAAIYNCFPPAYVVDEQGRPMHSWRVLVLPYVDGKAIYDRYDFSEPWNGPRNRELANEMPAAFHCPSDGLGDGTTTSYVAVVGPETLWPGSDTVPLHEIVDGLSNTILLVEVADSAINWMEPRDLPFSAVQTGINPPHGLGPSSHHPGTIMVAYADGSALGIQVNVAQDVFEALFTRAGGESNAEDY